MLHIVVADMQNYMFYVKKDTSNSASDTCSQYNGTLPHGELREVAHQRVGQDINNIIRNSSNSDEWTFEKINHAPWTFVGTSRSQSSEQVVLCLFNLQKLDDAWDDVPLAMFEAWFFIVFLAEDVKLHHAIVQIDRKYQELNTAQENLKLLLYEIQSDTANENEFIKLTIKSFNSTMINLDQAIKDQQYAGKKMSDQMGSIFNTGYAILLILVSVFLSVSINHIIYLMFRHREYQHM